MGKMISLKCPECGANLSVKKDLKRFYCQYCGTEILYDDGSRTITYRTVDEARIKEAEVKETIRLRELELEEKKRLFNRRGTVGKVIATIILGIVGLSMTLFGYLAGSESGDPNDPLFMVSMMGLFPLIAIMFVWAFGKKD